MIKKSVFSLFMASVLAFGTTVAKADEKYPRKPITMNVAYSPGGGNDVVARLIGRHIQKYIGKRMIVENNPGAGGQVGFTRLAKSKPDGYTIGLISVPSFFLIELLRDGVEFSLDDFEPIANIQSDPIVLVVNPSSEIKSFEDFIKATESGKSVLNMGGDGPQSNVHLQAAALNQALNIKTNFVSYPGSGPVATSLLSNEIDVGLLTASSALTYTNMDRLRPLVVFSRKKHPAYPDVPTISEVSEADVPLVGTALRGVIAPKGIADNQKQILSEAFEKLLQDEEFQEAAEKLGIVLTFSNAEEFKQELNEARKESEQLIDLIK